MSILYTADSHYGHGNIIKYGNRPYSDAEEMNEALVANWNNTVSNQDIVYHLGDFSFLRPERAEQYLNRLKGKEIHLIRGNHDSKGICALPRWKSVNDCLSISDSGQHIVLCHYAMRTWNRSLHGSLMLYGHSHGRLVGNNQSLDVGVDCWNYAPVRLSEIRKRMSQLPAYIEEGYR